MTTDDLEPESTGSEWSFTYEGPIHEVFPSLHEAQAAWLSQIDSLRAPDRKTHELIRMVCTVIGRNPTGVTRHARLAREVGATWEEVLGAILLTCPAFGVLPAVEAIPHARAGFDAAPEVEADDDE
jgi:alkylhydroperoxidase/carboxymuconolactone decarboxylase family protein YurZ